MVGNVKPSDFYLNYIYTCCLRVLLLKVLGILIFSAIQSSVMKIKVGTFLGCQNNSVQKLYVSVLVFHVCPRSQRSSSILAH